MYIYEFHVATPYAGTESIYKEQSETPIAEIDLNEMLADYVYEKAESFAYLRTGWEEDFEDEEDREMWIADCFESSYWEQLK